MELKLYENVHTGSVNTENLIKFLRYFLLIIFNSILFKYKRSKLLNFTFCVRQPEPFPERDCPLQKDSPLHSFHSDKIQETLSSLRGFLAIHPQHF